MAILDATKLDAQVVSFSELSLPKQIAILVGIAASIAIGFYVVLWSKDPDFAPIYANLDSKDAGQIIDVLNKNNIPNKYDTAGGGVLVPISKIDAVRMKLAAEGLPKGNNVGFELLDKPQGLGTSQFMESIRYRRGLEGELSRTISSLESVRAARVHLGIPKETSFLKKKLPASASVMLDLNPGHNIDNQQIDGIAHLVASSVPGLTKSSVSVVDQRGNLLSGANKTGMQLSMEQFSYTRQLETLYATRIENLLTPILGINGVHAQVTADLDFTIVEKTEQMFDSDTPSVRSESSFNEERSDKLDVGGIPGALSNQPPLPGEAPEQLPEGEGLTPATPVNKRNQSTKNFELDRSITHVKQSVGKLEKLSVAVVVNDKVAYDDEGRPTFTPLNETELESIRTLIRDAVGFDESRGDTITVVNSTFAQPPPVPEPVPLTILEQPWLVPVLKQVLAGILVLIIVLGVIRPMLKNLSQRKMPYEPEPDYDLENLKKEQEAKAHLTLPEPDSVSKERLDHVKKIAHEDSATTAQVVMNWVGKEDE